jgi:hypothetical protein
MRPFAVRPLPPVCAAFHTGALPAIGQPADKSVSMESRHRAPMPDTTRHLTLANGLHLTLRHAPRLKRSAAALRVHAGSRRAARWPGWRTSSNTCSSSAHPLPLQDGLMRYVQAWAAR